MGFEIEMKERKKSTYPIQPKELAILNPSERSHQEEQKLSNRILCQSFRSHLQQTKIHQ